MPMSRFDSQEWHNDIIYTFKVLSRSGKKSTATWINVSYKLCVELTLSELLFTVLFGDLHLEYRKLTDVGGESG